MRFFMSRILSLQREFVYPMTVEVNGYRVVLGFSVSLDLSRQKTEYTSRDSNRTVHRPLSAFYSPRELLIWVRRIYKHN